MAKNQDLGLHIPAEPGRSGAFRGLKRWQLLLVLLPMVLAPFGGLMGAAIGGLGMWANLSLARKQFAPALKSSAMTGVVMATYLVYFIFAGVVYASTHH